MKQRKIVVIEDEKNILEVIKFNLTREGFKTFYSTDGEQGLELIRKEKPDLVLLDLMLPGMDGLEVCRNLKSDETLRDIPVIMVTAKSEESDVVLGLGIGADDYIPKPFSPKELVARVKVALRRSPPGVEHGKAEGTIERYGITIDSRRHQVMIDDEKLVLTPTEFRLLYRLASEPGRVYTRDEMLSLINDGGSLVMERSVDAHIKSIRKKLGSHRTLVETVHGVGYRFKE